MPDTGGVRPSAVRTNVDLPEPFGPITAQSSPAPMLSDSSGRIADAVVPDAHRVDAEEAFARLQTRRGRRFVSGGLPEQGSTIASHPAFLE